MSTQVLPEGDLNSDVTALPPTTPAAGAAGAPADATYVVMSLNATLTNERVLTMGTNMSMVDGGANGPVTLSSAGAGSVGTHMNWGLYIAGQYGFRL